MNLFQAAVLGVVQGFTEFLPVSSSGHLVIVQEYFKIVHDTVAFDVFLHFATVLAILFYFKSDMKSLSKKMLVAIFLASIPAGFVGLFLEDYILQAFSSVTFVGFALLVTGVFNLISDYKLNLPREEFQKIGNKQAIIIGVFQAIAVLPGISRSGSTVFAGVMQNIDRKSAFRFSFIMSLPVILGANLIHLSRISTGASFNSNILSILIGGSLAFFTGLLSLKLLEMMMVKAKLNYFGIYCLVLGVTVIFLS
jgi:undecaprenyl-diphosphatase